MAEFELPANDVNKYQVQDGSRDEAMLKTMQDIVNNTGGTRANEAKVSKWGFNNDVDAATGEEIIASWGGVFNPLTDVIQTAQTLTITYNQATDGAGQTGARMLLISYLDANNAAATAYHTLGSDGSDVTAFTCLGVNRAVAVQFGASATNVNDITFTATTDTTIQARIPALESVTQQCIYHIPISRTLDLEFINVSTIKLAGGSKPEVIIKGYSFSRVTRGRYNVIDLNIDLAVENNVPIYYGSNPITFTGREVIYFTCDTDTDNAKISMRFAGTEYDS